MMYESECLAINKTKGIKNKNHRIHFCKLNHLYIWYHSESSDYWVVNTIQLRIIRVPRLLPIIVQGGGRLVVAATRVAL